MTLIARFRGDGATPAGITGLDADWVVLTFAASWFGHIVPHSGTEDFADWAGSARIRHDGEGAYFEIEVR